MGSTLQPGPAGGPGVPGVPGVHGAQQAGVPRWARLYPWLALALALLLGALAWALDRRAGAPVPALPGATAAPQGTPDLEVFVQPGCPHCEAALAWLEGLRRERPALRVAVHDLLREAGARERLAALAQAAGERQGSTPGVWARGTLLWGWRKDGSSAARVLAALDGTAPGAAGPAAADASVQVPWLGRVSARDVGLPLFTVVVGLVDGFNPCAMWVLLFLLSLLVRLESRARMLAVAGTFVLASGACYLAFMAAWLGFFSMVGHARTVQLLLGMLALFVAALHLKDAFALKVGASLSIPERAKPGLYARVTRVLRSQRLLGSMLGMVVLAFLVNTVEILCTAGLPALYVGVLSSHGLGRAAELGYLLLYQACYMLDDTLMLAIAVVTLSRTRLQERGGRWLKGASGLVVAVLGLLLLYRPAWLLWGG